LRGGYRNKRVSIGTNGCNTTLTICGTTYTAFGGGRGGLPRQKKAEYIKFPDSEP